MKHGVMELGLLSFGPVLVTLVIGVVTSLVLRAEIPVDLSDNLIIWVSMSLAMVILPFCYLRRQETGLVVRDLGVVPPAPLAAAGMAIVLCSLVYFKALSGSNLPLILAQNIPIAFCEEFWSKGVLFHVAERIFRSRVVVVIVCALIFGFVTHFSEPLLANLSMRVPMGLLTGFIYLKTKSIAWPVTLHFTYNMLIS